MIPSTSGSIVEVLSSSKATTYAGASPILPPAVNSSPSHHHRARLASQDIVIRTPQPTQRTTAPATPAAIKTPLCQSFSNLAPLPQHTGTRHHAFTCEMRFVP
eukprot:4463828-Amphidinium_carterae.2